MTVHEKIKERRKELGLSADQVAKALNVSRATIYRYESSDIEKLPTSILEPLCEILKTTPAQLLGWEDKEVYTIAAHRDGDTNWTTQELEKIEEYKKFLLSSRDSKK